MKWGESCYHLSSAHQVHHHLVATKTPTTPLVEDLPGPTTIIEIIYVNKKDSYIAWPELFSRVVNPTRSVALLGLKLLSGRNFF
jgi:hypothetical protein